MGSTELNFVEILPNFSQMRSLKLIGILLVFALILDFGPWMWVAIGLFTVFSATSDVAIDGYTIEMLNKDELGLANGIRIGLYRVAILTTGFLLILTDWFSWGATYFAGGVILMVCGWVCLMAPKEKAYQTRSERSLLAELKLILNYPFALALMFVLILMGVGLVDLKVNFSEGPRRRIPDRPSAAPRRCGP